MKVITINEYERFLYPEGINNTEEFISYLERVQKLFIPLRLLKTDNCVHPYYIENDIKLIYLNISNITSIFEEEIFVLTKDEYERKLNEAVSKLCVNCTNYEEDSAEDNMKGHREKLCLDGTCTWYNEI